MISRKSAFVALSAALMLSACSSTEPAASPTATPLESKSASVEISTEPASPADPTFTESAAYDLDSEDANFGGEIVHLAAKDATLAQEFNADIDKAADYYSDRGPQSSLADGRLVSIWGQLPSGDYVASVITDEAEQAHSDVGSLSTDGEFSSFTDHLGFDGFVESVAVSGANVAWAASSDQMMYPINWEIRVWDGQTDVLIGDQSYLADNQALVSWSLGVSDTAQVSFTSRNSDGQFFYHVGNGEDFRSNPDLPADAAEHPISVGTGFMYAESESGQSTVRYATAFPGENGEGDGTLQDLFTVSGPVSEETPISGNKDLFTFAYGQGNYQGKPHWFAQTADQSKLFALDVTGHEPSASMVCGTQLVWLTFDGEVNENKLFHVDTAAEVPAIRYVELADPGSLVCGDDSIVIYSGWDSVSGETYYWNYFFGLD